MADKLVDFLTKLSTDAELSKKYNDDPRSAVADFGLSAEDQKMVLSRSDEALQKRLDIAGSTILLIHTIT